ncbi:MAG: sulfotransferase [Xenococcaceae cyanobacterium]
MKQEEKINLIYIASTGRSGSTILDNLLGAHSQILTTGEIQIWPHEILQRGFQKCGCGKSIPDCPFRTKMSQKINPLEQSEPKINFFREKHTGGKTLRWQYLSEFMTKRDIGNHQLIETYGKNNYKLFQSLLETSEEVTGVRPEWIVDASKDPYRLLWLIKSGMFNIKVLHIIKDPRAFIYSMIRGFLAHPDKYSHLELTKLTVAKSLSWIVQNYLISKIAQNHILPEDYLFIPYEEFASQPNNILKKITTIIECDFEEEVINNFRQQEIHTIAGNRLARSDNRPIQLDQKWKTLLPNYYRQLTEIITGISKSSYGY